MMMIMIMISKIIFIIMVLFMMYDVDDYDPLIY